MISRFLTLPNPLGAEILKTLWPFFCFFGGKWRMAPRYPAPKNKILIEPFAGSAGYSLRYPDKRVRLYDIDEHILGVWDFLIHAPELEVMSLPLKVTNTGDLLDITQEARWLIGFWLNKGTVSPRRSPSKWMRDGWRPGSFWGEKIRHRIASQQKYIRHWEISKSSYENIPDIHATWFIDPPYSGPAGRKYRKNNIDYPHLADWSRSRSGQVIACENEGADWLPFSFLHASKGLEGKYGRKISREACWLNDDTRYY